MREFRRFIISITTEAEDLSGVLTNRMSTALADIRNSRFYNSRFYNQQFESWDPEILSRNLSSRETSMLRDLYRLTKEGDDLSGVLSNRWSTAPAEIRTHQLYNEQLDLWNSRIFSGHHRVALKNVYVKGSPDSYFSFDEEPLIKRQFQKMRDLVDEVITAYFTKNPPLAGRPPVIAFENFWDYRFGHDQFVEVTPIVPPDGAMPSKFVVQKAVITVAALHTLIGKNRFVTGTTEIEVAVVKPTAETMQSMIDREREGDK